MTTQHRYIQDKADAPLRHAVDDIMLLYHRRSGQTHMVVSPVPEILDVMAQGGALTAADLAARLSQSFDLGDHAEVQLENHLTALADLGLVRRV